MSRRVKIIFSIFTIALGGGLVYASVGNISTVGADSLSGNMTGTAFILASLIFGIFFIAVGVMTVFFMASSRTNK